MLRRIKGVTLRDKVKSVAIRKELGVNSIQVGIGSQKFKLPGSQSKYA